MDINNLAIVCLKISCLLSLGYIASSLLVRRYEKLLALSIFILISLSFAILFYAHITDDFSLYNVYYNSHTLKPLLYKIFGVWGNHEGSILLWIWMISLYALLLAFFLKGKNIKAMSLLIQNLVLAAFLLFCIFHSNPFIKMSTVEDNGLGFNPLLQDIGLTIHPPILYLGYVGFSTVFSISLASLITKKNAIEWAKTVKSWSTISWAFLTLGIGLGSWWAYRELGWGGFWFWDPVENSSLMPWLLSTALIHIRLLVFKSGKLYNFAILLSISIFILSLIGTFLVRSGLLISVHTFASDSERGFYLLLLICAIIASAFLTFICYARNHTDHRYDIHFISKFTALLVNNIILITAFFVVFIGTVYPIILEFLTGEVISVGAPYYNFFFRILLIGILFLMIIVLKLNWYTPRKISIMIYQYRFSFLTSIIIIAISSSKNFITTPIIFLTIFLLFSIIEHYLQKIKLFSSSLSCILKSVKSISKSYYSMIVTHMGVVFLVLGILSVTIWQEKKELYMKEGDSVFIGNMKVVFSKLLLVKQQNYDSLKGVFLIINSNNKVIGQAVPESRFYIIEKVKNTESSIYRNFLSDIYIVIGDIDKQRGIVVCIYYKPYINFIWIGVIGMFLGGIISVFPRMKNYRYT